MGDEAAPNGRDVDLDSRSESPDLGLLVSPGGRGVGVGEREGGAAVGLRRDLSASPFVPLRVPLVRLSLWRR
jgi:hypothetical protein